MKSGWRKLLQVRHLFGRPPRWGAGDVVMNKQAIGRCFSSFRAVLCLCGLGLVLSLAQAVPSAPPPNDTCAGAEVIPANGPFPHRTIIRDISSATTNGDPVAPSCLLYSPTNLTRSVWYSFRPATSSRYQISSCSDAPTATTVDDTVMAIYSSANGCAGPLVQITGGCDDDTCGRNNTQAAIVADLKATSNYFIVVWRYGTDTPLPDNSSLQLLIDLAIPPPNDTCENATPLLLNMPVTGRTSLGSNDYQVALSCFAGNGQHPSIAAGRDVVYSFTAPQTGNYSFRVSNFNREVSDPVLYVIDSCPVGPKPITISNCLAAANRAISGSAEEIFCLRLSAAQRVFVVVDDDSAASPGSSFLLEANVCNREVEPNDTSATANAIVCGIEAAISPSDDVDFYSLGTPADGSRLFALIDGATAGTSDFILRVVTDNGTVEYDSGNNDEPFGSLSSNVAGTPLANLPAYIRVDRTFGSAEPYRLFAVIQPPLSEATVEVEPNNALNQANSAANNYFYGSLSTNTDVDSYQFDAAQGDLVFLSLDGDPLRNNTPINAALELLDESGNVLMAVDDGASSSVNLVNSSTNSNPYPLSPGEGLVYRVSESATFYARVRISQMAAISSAGDYLLSISRNCIPGGAGLADQPIISSVVELPNGHVQITAQGTPGVAYRLISSGELNFGWSLPWGAQTANGDGSLQFDDPNPSGTQRFYRVTWP